MRILPLVRMAKIRGGDINQIPDTVWESAAYDHLFDEEIIKLIKYEFITIPMVIDVLKEKVKEELLDI